MKLTSEAGAAPNPLPSMPELSLQLFGSSFPCSMKLYAKHVLHVHLSGHYACRLEALPTLHQNFNITPADTMPNSVRRTVWSYFFCWLSSFLDSLPYPRLHSYSKRLKIVHDALTSKVTMAVSFSEHIKFFICLSPSTWSPIILKWRENNPLHSPSSKEEENNNEISWP